MPRPIHPTVRIYPNVVITRQAWQEHGHILMNGVKGHMTTIVAFPVDDSGHTRIKMHIEPLAKAELPMESAPKKEWTH